MPIKMHIMQRKPRICISPFAGVQLYRPNLARAPWTIETYAHLPPFCPGFVFWVATQVPRPNPKNKIIKAAWNALPKFISWQIWLERKKIIFRDKEQHYKLVANTVKGQLNEWLRDKSDDTNLNQ